GYIPWDDDIDVAMMREDYEIFLKEGQSLLKDGYFLQTFDTDGFVIWTLMMIFATVALVWAAHHKNLVRIFAGEEHATSFFKKKKKKA
ncbi:MAG: LicD family protein, partial [Clostridia bacterium]|nr:LicD family protein [Clostridia bacterium]